MVPIWKDYFISFGAVALMRYRIKLDNTVIFEGVAHRRPGEADCKIRLNDICADYLEGGRKTFAVERYSGSAWVSVTTVEFYANWSYDPDYDEERLTLSAPIIRKIAANQTLIATPVEIEDIPVMIHFEDGGDDTDYMTGISTAMNDFERALKANSAMMLNLSGYESRPISYIRIGADRYDVLPCCDYVLTYRNAFGGFDTLPIEGAVKRSDSIDRHTSEHEFMNGSENRAKVNHVNEVTRKVSLVTGWMTDDESVRMHNLLESPDVWMTKVSENITYPLVLTSNTCEYKTYKGNGCKLTNYTIEADIAQPFIRK